MKSGAKKKFVYFVVFMSILMISGVFAETVGLSDDTKAIVKDIIEKQGVDEADVQSIEKVDLESLPSQVDLKNIDTTSIEVYEVDYGGESPVFVLTASKEIEEVSAPSVSIYKTLLNFGLEEESSESVFLETATGVEGSLEQGYVMMRDGSITGLSTNIEIVEGQGVVEVIVYINGEEANFGNTIVGDSIGVKKDYDIQSFGIVEFERGDVVSVYAKVEGNLVFTDVINLIEISTAE